MNMNSIIELIKSNALTVLCVLLLTRERWKKRNIKNGSI